MPIAQPQLTQHKNPHVDDDDNTSSVIGWERAKARDAAAAAMTKPVQPASSYGRTFRVRRVLLLVGALLCACGSSESFSNKTELQVAVDKVVDGSWTGDDISLWDVSRVTSM